MASTSIPLETYEKFQEFLRIANSAAREAQEENRRLGIPNTYSINGIIYYELSNGELSRTDPYTPPALIEPGPCNGHQPE
jgi:hypothetical protein